MNILIVDDSSLIRLAVSDLLQKVNGVGKIKTASNGKMAIEYLEAFPFDITILDVEMPVMDGIEFLKTIKRKGISTKTIMFSNVTEKGAEKTIEALNLGALDFVTKISSSDGPGIEAIKDTLIPKIRSLVGLRKLEETRQKNSPETATNKPIEPKLPTKDISKEDLFMTPRVLCIGSSTGGPEALTEVFSNISNPTPFPIVIAQHMPAMFTKKLASHLDHLSVVTVKEAEEGEVLQNNVAYLAPGDYHLEIVKEGPNLVCRINQNEKVCFVRPSADVLFSSVNKLSLPHVKAIVLTGMGSDGKNGCLELASSGYPIIIQNKESSVVWGMPGAVAQTGIQNHEADLLGIASFINRIANI